MLDLSALDSPAVDESGGKPLSLAIDLIDEDPDQPRTEFDEDRLRELAATIKESGVKQPVSVRAHPSIEGRWMLNFGARRLRASKLAGKSEIPAFVDEALGSYDQVIENEQREALTHMELALFIQRRLKAGDSLAAIARGLGKSKAFVTFATALVDADDWLLSLYRQGTCSGLTELYELRRLHEAHREKVESWASGREAISRRDLVELKTHLNGSTHPAATPAAAAVAIQVPPPAQADHPAAAVNGRQSESAQDSDEAGQVDRRERTRKARLALIAERKGNLVQLVLDVATEDGTVYVRPLEGGERELVPLKQLKLLRVGEVQ